MSSCLLQAVHTHWQYKKRFIHENSYIQPQPKNNYQLIGIFQSFSRRKISISGSPQNKYSLQETHSQIDEHQNRV